VNAAYNRLIVKSQEPELREYYEGREEGREVERKEFVKNLLSLGMDDDFIIKATGLDMALLEKIKNSLNL